MLSRKKVSNKHRKLAVYAHSVDLTLFRLAYFYRSVIRQKHCNESYFLRHFFLQNRETHRGCLKGLSNRPTLLAREFSSRDVFCISISTGLEKFNLFHLVVW